MAAIFEDVNTPAEVYVGNPTTGRFEKLTSLGDALKGIALGRVEVVHWRSGDDRFDVEGFLVKPPDFSPHGRYPLLVNMHGGPRVLYQNAFIDVNFRSASHTPAQLYAAHGYLVLLPNKRGDDGYGAEFAAAHTRRWGEDVEYDVLPGVDALVAQGLADPEKLGIMGASYGGTATAWAIGHTTRFKAASIDDAPINLLSYYSQGYLTHDTWMDPFMGGSPSVAMDQYLEKSPVLYASAIVTPTLLRYGGERFPRPISIGPLQGMELFRALHERGVPVEFIYHPTQGHGIADEEVYRDWVERNLRWFDYWVMGRGPRPLDSTLAGTRCGALQVSRGTCSTCAGRAENEP
jgi:dipeptidyl aminopeptidase/acylaminoacyl peptidase